jgi:hypothetical protein
MWWSLAFPAGVSSFHPTVYCNTSKAFIKITRDLSQCGLAIYIKKYLKAKEELWKLEYFTLQKYNLQKILLKKPKSFKILL